MGRVLRQQGVVYDVGRALDARSINWRPDYSPALVRRELGIIRDALHANAVRLCGRDPRRLLPAVEYAASLGLDVWVCPELWNATPTLTLRYLGAVAEAAEPLRRRWPDQLTFSLGNEFTLFMRGIVPGRNHGRRATSPALAATIRSGRHTPPLRAFLAEAAATVRGVYTGPISYCALPFEQVDWSLFDVVGINHYRQTRGMTTERYLVKIARLRAIGKPVAITEFGYPACRETDNPDFLSTLNATPLSLLGSGLGRFVRPRVRSVHDRDEPAQADRLIEQLTVIDRSGVDAAFVTCFSFQLGPYSDDPRHDIDAITLSLVRTLPPGETGTTYLGLPWEPKQAFHASRPTTAVAIAPAGLDRQHRENPEGPSPPPSSRTPAGAQV